MRLWNQHTTIACAHRVSRSTFLNHPFHENDIEAEATTNGGVEARKKKKRKSEARAIQPHLDGQSFAESICARVMNKVDALLEVQLRSQRL